MRRKLAHWRVLPRMDGNKYHHTGVSGSVIIEWSYDRIFISLLLLTLFTLPPLRTYYHTTLPYIKPSSLFLSIIVLYATNAYLPYLRYLILLENLKTEHDTDEFHDQPKSKM